jgi:hypothetical protein
MEPERNGAEADALGKARRAAAETDPLGPGTAGYTTSGAAYRGKEIASSMGVPGPADPGFTTDFGLGYDDREEGDRVEYAPADPPRQ